MPRHGIRLHNVSYPQTGAERLVLHQITLSIPIGGRIASLGASGSGKTITANHLLGLLRPCQGSRQLDGIEVSPADVPAWQANCADVPPAITL